MRTLALAALPLFLSLATIQVSQSGNWSNSPNAWWFNSLKEPDNPALSCCGLGDAVEADNWTSVFGGYLAIVTNGHGVIDNGIRIFVPESKVVRTGGNPTGHTILFTDAMGGVYCFVPGVGA